MTGFIFALIAGATMSVQGVFNTRVSEKIGLLESNLLVQGTAFLIAVIAMFIFGKGDITRVLDCNKLYLTGGILGFVITITVMLAIGKSSPAVAVSSILIAQLLVASLIEAFGIMGSEKVPFLWNKYAGLALMIIGMILFKFK